MGSWDSKDETNHLFEGFMTLTLTLSLHQMTLTQVMTLRVMTPYYKGICTLLNLYIGHLKPQYVILKPKIDYFEPLHVKEEMIRVISDSSPQLMTPDSDSPFKNLPNESGVKSHDS